MTSSAHGAAYLGAPRQSLARTSTGGHAPEAPPRARSRPGRSRNLRRGRCDWPRAPPPCQTLRVGGASRGIAWNRLSLASPPARSPRGPPAARLLGRADLPGHGVLRHHRQPARGYRQRKARPPEAGVGEGPPVSGRGPPPVLTRASGLCTLSLPRSPAGTRKPTRAESLSEHPSCPPPAPQLGCWKGGKHPWPPLVSVSVGLQAPPGFSPWGAPPLPSWREGQVTTSRTLLNLSASACPCGGGVAPGGLCRLLTSSRWFYR